MIVGLDALESKIDITYGYQYVVVPFTRIGALNNLEKETIDEMSDLFGAWALQPEVAKIIGDSNPARNIALYLLPDPLADNDLRHERKQLLKEEFERTGLDAYFPDYFSMIHC